MAEVRYVAVEGEGHGRELPVAASQYVASRGGKWAKLVAGRLTLCASGDGLVAGWMNIPANDDGYDAWKSSTTAGADKIFLNYGLDLVCEMPADETLASLNASWIGMGVGIIATPFNGYTNIQKAKIGATASPLVIVGVDTVRNTVLTRIKPTHYQAL
jgi:hypothetical protein